MKRISVLMATAFVDMLGFAMIFPLLPFYALRLNAPEWVIGWMIATFSIFQLAAAPVWGRISDRYGRRPAILAGLALSAVAFVVFGFAVTIWMLFLSRFIQGVGTGTVGVLQAYVGDSIEPRDRAKALGWLSAATASGVMIGPAIGSTAYRLGPEAPGLIAAALCLVNVLFAWRWLPESKRPLTESGARAALVLGKRSILSMIHEVFHTPHGEVPRLIWIYAIGMLGFMSVTAVLALYLQADFGVTEETIGIFFVYVGALSVVMRALVLGKLVDLFGETKVMRMGAALLALGILLIPVPSTVVTLGIVLCLIPIGTACLFPSVSALVTHQVSKHELGQTLGVQQAFGGSARVIAPIWATAAFQGLGKDVPFYIAAAVVAVVVLLALRVPEAVVPTEPAKAV